MDATGNISSSENKASVPVDWDEVLHILWKNGKRNWTIYTSERFRKFWDIRTVEHRKEKEK